MSLLPQHEALIRASAISEEVAAARGYRSVEKKADLLRLGFSDRQAIVPALLLPVWGAAGGIATYQSRPDTPRVNDRGKAVKYETPRGARMVLDVPPPARGCVGDPSRPLYVTEGLRKADSAVSIGLCCVAVLGVWNWRGTNEQGGTTALADWEYVALKGREVYIAFDSDVMRKKEVRAALERLASFLAGRGALVKYILLPPRPDGGKQGLDDFIGDGNGVAELMLHAVEALPPLPADAADGADDGNRRSQADVLAGIADRAELFHDPAGDLYATIGRAGHAETWPIRSQAFRRWLVGAFYAEQGKAPSSQAITDALNVAQARAQFDGPEVAVYVRVAPDGDGGIYVDLGDDAWRAAHVTAGGWEVVDAPPVRFRRSPGARPLPEPAHSAETIDGLRGFLNVPEEQWPPVKAWLAAALRDWGPYPVLGVEGEQGSGKSMAARMLRRLVDPAVPELRADPREPRDVAIAARATWLAAFDNISQIKPWLSDVLCRLSTGGGFATRELYSDFDEALFDARRPVLLNGITEFIERDDLRDRAVKLVLPTIPDEKRQEERVLWATFEEAAPRLFGALLTYVAGALRELPNVKLERLPRMADFATWAVAAERGAGHPAAEPSPFLAAYEAGRAAGHQDAIDGSLIGPPLARFLDAVRSATKPDAAEDAWTGIAADLLRELDAQAGDLTKIRDWPKKPRVLADELRRLAPALRAAGYRVELPERTGHTRKRVWTLAAPPPTAPRTEKPPETSSASSASSAASSDAAAGADERGVGADEHRPPATEVRPHSSAGGAPLELIADDADEADEVLPAIPGPAAWEDLPDVAALRAEYSAWFNGRPAGIWLRPTAPDALVADAWERAYEAQDLTELLEAHARCLAIGGDQPAGIPLGVAHLDRTIYQEGLDAGLRRAEAAERARVGPQAVA